MKMFTKFLFVIVFLAGSFQIFSQIRVAVLPFRNMDGNMQFNKYCYKLQEELTAAFIEKDKDAKLMQIVPADSIESILAGLNLDPNNPQYQSDLWKVLENMNVNTAILASFNIQANRFLINAFIYDVRTKIPNLQFQAKDIFKSEQNLSECIPVIVKRLYPFYMQK
jgi:hypothetical protein